MLTLFSLYVYRREKIYATATVTKEITVVLTFEQLHLVELRVSVMKFTDPGHHSSVSPFSLHLGWCQQLCTTHILSCTFLPTASMVTPAFPSSLHSLVISLMLFSWEICKQNASVP